MADWIPVVPARGGAVAASGLYYTVKFLSSIELARAVRQPGPCVRVNFSKLCAAVQEHDLRWNDPSRTRRTQEVPFIARCSHLTRKNKVSCSGFLPKTKPMQPFQFVLQQHVHIHSLQCDLHPRVAEHQGRTDIKWWQTEKCRMDPNKI